MVTVQVRRLDDGARLPSYALDGDAGADLCAAVAVHLAPAGGRAMVATGLALAIPAGHVGYVMPRSGLAIRHGVTVVNAPGVIDSGYRGELSVLMINTDPIESFDIAVGDRIAQLVIQTVESANFQIVDSLDDTERGDGGFGHTGIG